MTGQIAEVQETVEQLPNESRNELCKIICEHLDWVTAKGDYKVGACMGMLEHLEQHGIARACPEGRVVTVCDREGDFWELIARAQQTGAALLVRASRGTQPGAPAGEAAEHGPGEQQQAGLEFGIGPRAADFSATQGVATPGPGGGHGHRGAPVVERLRRPSPLSRLPPPLSVIK